MAQFQRHFVQELTKPLIVRQCGDLGFTGDNLSDVISVDLYTDGVAYSGGGTCAGACICPDGSTVALTGSVSGKTASVTLKEDCFAIPGQIGIGIRVTTGTTKTTVLKCIYNVELFATNNPVDPGSRITLDVVDLINRIDAAVESIPASADQLKAAMAPNFSDTTAYPAGAYVWYNGTLYKFTTAHAAGSWTGTDATAVALGNDVADLRSSFHYRGIDISTQNWDRGFINDSGNYQLNSNFRYSLSKTPTNGKRKVQIVCPVEYNSCFLSLYNGETYLNNVTISDFTSYILPSNVTAFIVNFAFGRVVENDVVARTVIMLFDYHEQELIYQLDNLAYNILSPTAKSIINSGVTVTSNGDETFTMDGTASARLNYHLFGESWTPFNLPAGTYRFICSPSGANVDTYFAEIALKDSNGNTILDVIDSGDGNTFTINVAASQIYCALSIKSGATASNVLFKPMLTTDTLRTYSNSVGYTGDGFETNQLFAQINQRIKAIENKDNIIWKNEVTPPYWILHLDCGRKYFTVANVKALIDMISTAGFNQMQLHFSEDTGFRLGLNDMIVTTSDGVQYDLSPCLGGEESPNSYYSQLDMNEIISYAQLHGIDIVPSLDMPGHIKWVLFQFRQFRYGTSNTLDITNPDAVKFAYAIVDKYSKYFVSRGCKYWNIGCDEIVNSDGFETFYQNGQYNLIVDFANGLSEIIKKNGMIPRIFNEALFYRSNYNNYITKDFEVLDWYHGTNLATADHLMRYGYKLINQSAQYYWILTKSKVTVDTINATNLLRNYYGASTSHNGWGAVLSIWCDSASSDVSSGDGGNSVVNDIPPVITAFGNAIKRILS